MSWSVATYQAAERSILVDMSPRRPHGLFGHLGKASLGLLAGVAGLGCALLVVALAVGGVSADLRDGAVLVAWTTGIVAAVLSVLAFQEHTDPDDDPRYLQTIVHGLRQEWRR